MRWSVQVCRTAAELKEPPLWQRTGHLPLWLGRPGKQGWELGIGLEGVSILVSGERSPHRSLSSGPYFLRVTVAAGGSEW